MKKSLLLPIAALIATTSQAQNWKLVSENEAYPTAKKEYQSKKNQKIFKLDRKTLEEKLVHVSSRGKNELGTIIIMPNLSGKLERFEIWEASNFSEKIQEKHPKIRSYVGRSLADPYTTIRFSKGPSGISSTIFRANDSSEYLETYSTDGQYFEIHKKRTPKNKNTQLQYIPNLNKTIVNHRDSLINNEEFTVLRLALSVTGEYTQHFGGTKEKALEAMNNTLTRVNGVLERDLAISLKFIDNIEDLIYTDPETDPYSVYIDGNTPSLEYNLVNNWMVELQTNLRDNIGEDNYDLGHLLGYNIDDKTSTYRSHTNCVGCVCESSFPKGKGSGTSSRFFGDPKGEDFDYAIFAHQIAHQLGANITSSHFQEGTGIQVEPGSGSTIMGDLYAYEEFKVQENLDDYFANVSIKQIKNNLNSKSCGIKSTMVNTSPKIEIEKNIYYIPIGTAFKLDAKITDTENDAVLVNWEQNDWDPMNEGNYDSRVGQFKELGPNFRSVKPTKETYRYFPNFNHILNDNLVDKVQNNVPIWEIKSTWESITAIPREYNFTITARDNNPNGALTSSGKVKVIASPNTTPFKINSPNIDNKLNVNSATFNVTWDVANTNKAPIETTHVKVSISWDGGDTFEELGVVENTGTANFATPTDTTLVNDGYIMIEAVDNIFLAVQKFASENTTLSTKDINVSKVNIYPNPSKGDFNIELKAIGNIKIEITDLNGRKVYTENDIANGNYKKQIHSKLPSGKYIITITSTEGTTNSKIIIK